MTSTSTYKISLLRLLNLIVIMDLIFGGSGRLITIGTISFRTVLFGMIMVYLLLGIITNSVYFDGKSLWHILLFVTYIIINALLVGDRDFSAKFDFLSRYLYILLVLFYDAYFYRYSRSEDIESIRKLFETFTLLFALFSIALWLYAYKLGGAAYNTIEYGFFRPKVYGNFDILANGIPRIFMKSSIFVPVGLLFQLDRLIDRVTTWRIIKVILYTIAIISTFTTGLFIATAICVFVLLRKRHVMTKRTSILFFLLLSIGVYAIARFGIVRMMVDRFSNADYTSTYRLTQLESIIREFFQKPVFGHGFAYEYTTIYGSNVRTTSGFEIAWGELLVDTGIVGFILFASVIISVLRRLRRLSRNSRTIYVFLLGLVLICIESFTNPFINNSIGLTFFSICAGICCSVGESQALCHEQMHQ